MSHKINKKQNTVELYPLVLIPKGIFNKKSPYRGIWLHFQEDANIHIEKGFATSPENGKLKIFADSESMKEKIQNTVIGEKKLTVETWKDLSDRVDRLEEQMKEKTKDINTINNTAVFTVLDTYKKSFWVAETTGSTPEFRIPSDSIFRVCSSASEYTKKEDLTIKILNDDSGQPYVNLSCPVIQCAKMTDEKYDPNTQLIHRVQNNIIQTSTQFQYKDEFIYQNIWSYTDINKNRINLSYPIGDHGKFTSLEILNNGNTTVDSGSLKIEKNIYLLNSDSKIRIKKGEE